MVYDPRSPFPGMDPYLEQHWRDVHQRLCTYACDALQPQVRPALVARLEERLLVETETEQRSIYPDVKIVERRPSRLAGTGTEGDIAVVEPMIVRGEAEPAFEGFIQIVDQTSGGKLVTVIEVLSPSNKYPGEGHKTYKQKQRELAEARVSLVEIDLLRSGEWTVGTQRRRVPPSPYRVSVHRGWKGDEYEYWAIYLDQRLPTIRIPLREQDNDAHLDLQALIDQVYANGAYDSLDYKKPAAPPLEGAEANWADELLAGKGRR